MREMCDLLIAKLIERLDYENPITRRNAAGALRLHGARAIPAIPALERLVNDENKGVRQEVRRALDSLCAKVA